MSEDYMNVPVIIQSTHDSAALGKIRKTLREALLQYFPKLSDIRPVLDASLGISFEHIAGGANYSEMIFEFVDWLGLDLNGRLKPFLEEAKSQLPITIPVLDGIVKRFDAVVENSSQFVGTSIYDLHKAIQTVLKSLESRKQLFGYLNAYKELHEILHEISRSRPRVSGALDARLSNQDNAFAIDVVDSLADWISRSQQYVKDTEFPAKPLAWIEKLVDSANKLTVLDTGKWSDAMEQLLNIPRREMGKLNDRLIDCAERLRSGELTEQLNIILSAVHTTPNTSQTAEIGMRVTRFRDLCSQNVQLVRAHSLCQETDDLLREASGLSVVYSQSFMDWSEISGKLSSVVEICPKNFRAQRTKEAAKKFELIENEVSAAKEEFAILKCLFNDMFHEMDRDLLRTLNRISNEVHNVTKVLEGYS